MIALKRAIPNLLTAGNLVGGIFAIIFSLTGKIELAPYCILLSALFDFLDGFAARLLKVQNELGKQLDSLADMVTFGVAPGIMMFVLILEVNVDYYLSHSQTIHVSQIHQVFLNFGQYFALIIPVFALFRLAKFNLDTRQSDSFIGLPTPAMTLYFAMLPLLLISAQDSNVGWQINMAEVIMSPLFLILSILVLSILMVSEIPLFALKFKHFKWTGNEIRFIFLILSILLFVTVFFWAIPLIIILYLILSIVNNKIAK
jgi:CDP-diacylglycerol--serine O-phosphatidyltransferase